MTKDLEKIIKELEDILPLLEKNFMDNNYDCYGCCGCCSEYDDNQEAVAGLLRDVIKELKGEN